MADKLDFSFKVFQTTFRVVYDDITHLDADIIVSTDDTFFSASSGISKKIQEIVGKSILQKEIRKQTLPVPVGTVLLTSSGPLKTNYIAHVALLDFAHHLQSVQVIPKITGRIMDVGDALQVKSIVTPVLIESSLNSPGNFQAVVSQLTGQPVTQALDIILRSLAQYVIAKNRPISLQTITIAMYQDDADDHAVTEQQLLAELAPLHQEIITWTATLDSVNAWMVHIQPLLAHLDESDQELRDLLKARFQGGQDVLNKIFGLPDPDQSAAESSLEAGTSEAGPLNQEEFKHRQQRLTSILSDLKEEIDSLEKQTKDTRRRLYVSQEELAKFGELEAPAHLKLEIEDTAQEIEQLDLQRKDLQRQQIELRQQLAILESRWHTQQAANGAS